MPCTQPFGRAIILKILISALTLCFHKIIMPSPLAVATIVSSALETLPRISGTVQWYCLTILSRRTV